MAVMCVGAARCGGSGKQRATDGGAMKKKKETVPPSRGFVRWTRKRKGDNLNLSFLPVNPRITSRFNLATPLVSQVSFSGCHHIGYFRAVPGVARAGYGAVLLERNLIYRRTCRGPTRRLRGHLLDEGRNQRG